MKKPDTAGIYRFEGRRQYSKREDHVPVRAVVEVRAYKWGYQRGLAVFFFGRTQPYRPELFEGEWEKLDVSFEGGMVT